jgi:hypothetical protein
LVAAELVEYFRKRGVAWVMCIAVPYHATSCAAIVLQVDQKSAESLRPNNSLWWSADDIEQLEEISAQGACMHLITESWRKPNVRAKHDS